MSDTALDVERLANYFVGYLFDQYKGSNHVRRVATWIGFIVKAIERASGGDIQRNRSRQVLFGFRGHTFKIRYNHKAGPRGGIEIVESLDLQGRPDALPCVTITNLGEAEDVYHSLEAKLDEYLR
jgi:hypothetical protein